MSRNYKATCQRLEMLDTFDFLFRFSNFSFLFFVLALNSTLYIHGVLAAPRLSVKASVNI